ncbi:DUF1566 domain-containing protein [Thiobaca trueperi]|uniref:Uncharacterized protein DUF1566 n=1 Tax=Thiobaca trueperi TaxID=127458 RepID=A0A4R3MVR5_9GAMM|nr:DUF1566 domain-containing protein [Thiobaca trueperi]TCT19847.1 uncharacterized protein DUF1566 [Thiobaca trueperi]
MIRPSRSLLLAVLVLLTLAGVRPALAQVSQFTVNADGTVTDSVTGLIWDRCSWGQDPNTCAGTASLHDWQQALGVAVTANGASHKGHTDWRLPNRNELESLVKITASNPAIDTNAFPNTPSGWYWSSTPYTPGPAYAWYVTFNDGNAYAGHHGTDYRVRLVRGGQLFDTFDALAPSHSVTSSAGTGGGISPTGAQTINHDATTTFTVTPDTGYSLASVGGTCGGSLSGTAYTTNAITGACTVEASFTLNSYSVTPSAGANGSISPTTVQTINHGATATFTVTPNPGYTASVGGTCGGSLSGTTYTTSAITGACTVEASFTLNSYSVTPSAGANGSISPTTVQTINHGTTATFTVTPNPGYIASVGGTCGGSLSGTAYTTNAITANCTAAASFNWMGGGGPSPVNGVCGSAHNGLFHDLPPSTSALCASGTVSAVTGSGPWTWNCLGFDGGTTASCRADRAVQTYTLTTTVSVGGTVSPPSQVVNAGATATFTLIPATGYAISSASGCGGSLSGANYATAPVTAACTVTANFAANWMGLVGDWDGDGAATAGLYNPVSGTFYLRNANTSGLSDVVFRYGPAPSGWWPLAGDWNGDGISTVGLYDPVTGIFYLRNTHTPGFADVTFRYGPQQTDWYPLAGDWNGDGIDTVGLYVPQSAIFFLRNTHTPGVADVSFRYGPVANGWLPLAGDWNHDGTTTIGLYDGWAGLVYLRQTNAPGVADVIFRYGPVDNDWWPLGSDWNGDGTDSIGLFKPVTRTFYLRDSNAPGGAQYPDERGFLIMAPAAAP